MADRPGDFKQPSDQHVGEPEESNDNTSAPLDFNWTAADSRSISAARAATDRATVAEHGVLTLQYGDPNFDQKLQTSDYDTLQVEGFPQGTGVSSWMDSNGVFFWFKNGHDNRKHHYLTPGMKTIVIHGVRQDCDEMRLEASQAFLAEADPNGVGFSSVTNATDPLQYAMRLATIADGPIALEDRILAQSSYYSPTNPYFRIYLADMTIAQAMKPIYQQVVAGQNVVNFNNPETLQGIDYAVQLLQTAHQIANQYGEVGMPDTDMMPELHPFALNPAYYNPDMYWGGALYQTHQRELLLSMLRNWVQNAGQLEMPPAGGA